jgi:hypothetical protein
MSLSVCWVEYFIDVSDYRKQVSLMIRSCLGSLFMSIFQWFYTGGPHCGLTAFPSFGLQAFNRG